MVFTLTGQVTLPSGAPFVGFAQVTPLEPVRDTAGHVVRTGAESQTLDSAGSFTFTNLPDDTLATGYTIAVYPTMPKAALIPPTEFAAGAPGSTVYLDAILAAAGTSVPALLNDLDIAVAGVLGYGGATDTALAATYVRKWKASTAYAQGEQVVNPSGQVVSALTAFTSGSSYVATNWSAPPTSGIVPDAASQLIQSRLAAGVNDITLGVASDSTLNDSSDGVRVWLADLGAAYPSLCIKYGIWSDTNQTMQDPLATLQAGSSSSSTGGTGVVSDAFTRTDAELVGDVADTGQTWAGTAGKWSTNGTAALCGGTGDATISVGVSGDMTARANITLDTTPAAGSKTFALYSNWASSQNQLWVQVNVSTGGVVSTTVWKRIANTATQIATLGALGLTPNAANTFDMVLSLSGLTVTATVNSVSATGAILDTDTASLGTLAGFGAKAANTAGTLVNSFSVDTPLTAGTVQTLTVYNGATPGKTLAYHQTRVAAMFPAAPDVVLIASGHNNGSDTPATFLTANSDYITALHAVYPNALLLMASQNPQFSPASTVTLHLKRQVEVRQFATRNNYGYLPVLETYRSKPNGGASYVGTDGIHPTTGAGAGTGAQLWSDTMNAHLTACGTVV